MNASPRLDAALARLEARIDWERRDRSAGWRVDLAPIRDLVERAEWPCRSHRTCHVAGSKGKGSVASLIAAGLGIVLYNVILSGLAIGLFILGFARPAPATA